MQVTNDNFSIITNNYLSRSFEFDQLVLLFTTGYFVNLVRYMQTPELLRHV